MPPTLTFFDTPGRDSAASIVGQAAGVARGALPILDGLPEPTLLLNEHRQIVVANRAASQLAAKLGGSGEVAGLRIGEALGCVNVENGPDGCGTTPQCPHCGAGRANRAFGLKPAEYEGEFRLRSSRDGIEAAQTFHVHLAPLQMNGSSLRLMTLADITAEKSREILGQIFFHDVLNTAQAVKGAAQLIPGMDDPEALNELAHTVSTSSAALVAEIEAQRDLLRAEAGDLSVHREEVKVGTMVRDIAALYRRSRFGVDRHIDVLGAPADDSVVTSAVHLSRSIGNLVKNALEASAAGQRVTLRVMEDEGRVRVDVHNAAVMPAPVQAQVFQRFFSTKASSGRGMGTYSVRLLVTQSLGGTVTFTSIPGQGTTFTILLPRGYVSRSSVDTPGSNRSIAPPA